MGQARIHKQADHPTPNPPNQTQIEDFLLGGPLTPEVEAAESAAAGAGGQGAAMPLYDWWGSMHHIRRRGPERLSIIFAFDDPK